MRQKKRQDKIPKKTRTSRVVFDRIAYVLLRLGLEHPDYLYHTPIGDVRKYISTVLGLREEIKLPSFCGVRKRYGFRTTNNMIAPPPGRDSTLILQDHLLELEKKIGENDSLITSTLAPVNTRVDDRLFDQISNGVLLSKINGCCYDMKFVSLNRKEKRLPDSILCSKLILEFLDKIQGLFPTSPVTE